MTCASSKVNGVATQGLVSYGERSVKMEVIYFTNEFPKEDLTDIYRILHNQSKDNRHRLLAQFIFDATKAVKSEISQLPSSLRQLIPPFETLFDWAENLELRDGLLCGAVDGVLLILAQISTYIR